MYVKELTVRGFKSFANSTTLRFEPGITAIVGPNGSGKSNIVDALAWVMGEQGAKSLRGTSMEDVIFAGTSTRAPLGRAQVSLTIDNSDGVLNIDYSEVTISRTIFRNGGSEYAINGSPVRLLDVQELLSDTGLGAHMHVVVGQGRLDSILRATPEDNRAFIEEAAGILKHRKRKERALRKLKSTQENVERLDDLLSEIQRQLGPLRRQAKISKRADSIQVIIRDATSRLLADDAHTLTELRDDIRQQLVQVRRELSAAQQELTATKLDIERLESIAGQSTPAIDAINQQWHALSQLQERFKALGALASERANSWQRQIVHTGSDDPGILRSRARELETQMTTLATQRDDSRIAFDKATERRAQIEQEVASIRQLITQMRKSAQEQETHKAQLREMIARQEAVIHGVIQRYEDVTKQKESYLSQLTQAQGQLDELRQVTHEDDTSLQAQLQDAQNSRDALRVSRDNLQSRYRELESTRISLLAKADALKDTLDSRKTSGDIERSSVQTLGQLAEFIHIEEGWEEAIAKALGPFSSAIVVPDSAQAYEAMSVARREKIGRAVVIFPASLSALSSQSARSSQSGVDSLELSGNDSDNADNPYGVREASRVISLDPATIGTERENVSRGIVLSVQALLADVGLLDEMPAGQAGDAMRAQYPHIATFITRDADLYTTYGATGGISRVPSDLSLSARRAKAVEQAEELAVQMYDINAQLEAVSQQYEASQKTVDEARKRVTEHTMRLEHVSSQIKAMTTSVESLERRVREIDSQIDNLLSQRTNHEQTLEQTREELQVADSVDNAHSDIDATVQRERDLDNSLTQAREEEVSARLTWNNATSQHDSLSRQVSLLLTQADQAQERRERIAQKNAHYEAQSQQAQRISVSAQNFAVELQTHIDSVTERRAQLQAEVSLHDEELTTLRDKRNAQEPVVLQLQRQEHDVDIQRERIATQYGQITQKIMDELGSTVEYLVSNFGPDKPVPVFNDDGQPIALRNINDKSNSGSDDVVDVDDAESDNVAQCYKTVPFDRAEQTKLLEKAKRDLVALGKVNPLATEEFDALETRHKYLAEQRQDVVTSRDDLLSLIKELDATMVEVFKSAFEDTAEAFKKVFATLFPGGTGTLRLDNPDDLLTCGVVVEASPAGKRVKQLSLLSGGERSLTALALLFAIFTARPSPFYIMDEVEAALDDVNLTRLLNAMNELREHAQLIVITHQQRTMSIADALYGVTMRADGVTAVVSQKLTQGRVIGTDNES